MDLKKLRARVGKTQQEVAEACGLSRSAYTNIENGNRTPSIKSAKLLGTAFGIDWRSIYDEVDEDDTARDTAER